MSEGCAPQDGAPHEQLPEQALVPEALPIAERALTEADNLNRHRLPDGSHSPWALEETLKNLIPYVKEGGMPSAVSDVYQEYVPDYEEDGYRKSTFVWLGRSALQVALSGYRYHKAPQAHARVWVEAEEAVDGEQNLCPGKAKVFVSPHMSETDAPKEIAEMENLATDDSLRISWLDKAPDGRIKGRHMQSLLIRDIPLQAWVDWLADPANIFGKSIVVENPKSALSVMKVFRELDIDLGKLPEDSKLAAVITDVLPHITDPEAYESVRKQRDSFLEDQRGKHQKAVNIARRWRDFEAALADSLPRDGQETGFATPVIEAFVYQMSHSWTPEQAAFIRSHQIDGTQKLRVTRELGALIEEAQRKLFYDAASVVTANEDVLKQLNPETVERIRQTEMRIQRLYDQNDIAAIAQLQARNNNLIASQNIENGRGCPGKSAMMFKGKEPDLFDVFNLKKPENGTDTASSEETDQSKWEEKDGVCVVKTCPTRPDIVKVGPCGVCMNRCQEIYNNGGDPTAESVIISGNISTPRKEAAATPQILDWLPWRTESAVGALSVYVYSEPRQPARAAG